MGVYDYVVTQEPGTNRNCIYSADSCKVTVFVTNSETGGLDVTVVAYCNDAEKKSDIVFPNRYADPVSVTVKATKTLDGKMPKDGTFTFQLTDEYGNAVTAQNVGGEVIFPAMTKPSATTSVSTPSPSPATPRAATKLW